jgi:acyl-CoA thioesterase
VASRFDTDTALTPAGDGVFDGRIDRGWWVQRGPNGGYVAAIILRGMVMAVDAPARSPRSLTVHYLRPPEEGPVRVETRIERAGRSLSSVSARLVQDDQLLALALGAFAESRSGPSFSDPVMPEVPPPERCEPSAGGLPEVPIRDRFETRRALGGPPFSGADRAETGGWIRPEDPRPLDHLLLAALTDAWIPAFFSRSTPDEMIAVPTIDLNVHFRSPLPSGSEDGYLLACFRSRIAADGFLEEDGELWSRDGVLLAQSRQLAAMVPMTT